MRSTAGSLVLMPGLRQSRARTVHHAVTRQLEANDSFRICKNSLRNGFKKRTVDRSPRGFIAGPAGRLGQKSVRGGIFLEKITNLFDYEIFARVIKAGSLSA